ncbi:MAG: hypothetical protein DLM72_13515 [Candidatus Nitrosopolaris wilkensis]|nr:MAG: hypothetical protein DLM72_13515 [Candidatus Nitrosopolaris wilkensis]
MSAAQKVSNRLVELAEIKPGQRVLDVATGIGEPAITAAKIVGAVGDDGHVVAIDISSQRLEIAKERAAALGLQNIIEFKEIDAENLLFGLPQSSSSYFNAILCRWGLMSLADLSSALDNIYGLLADEGRFATAVWSIPSKVPLLSIPMYIVTEQLGFPAPQPGSPGPFSLSDIDALKNSLSRVGFKDIHSEALTVTFGFVSAQEYVRFVRVMIIS